MTTVADEDLLLDLLNSTPLIEGVEQDRLDETEAWRSWLSSHEEVSEAKGWKALVAARSALQDVVRGEQPSSALTPFLRGVRWVPSMSDDGLEWTLEAPPEHSIAIRAVLAWNEVETTKPGRIRSCENPDCQLFLIDHSKSNTARWCSMATCGNRMKARRHYQSKSGGQ